jgi:hypothetical protein
MGEPLFATTADGFAAFALLWKVGYWWEYLLLESKLFCPTLVLYRSKNRIGRVGGHVSRSGLEE